jgi:hypothetical protein
VVNKAEYLSQHDLPARLEAMDRLRSRFDKWPNCFEATVSRPSQLAAGHFACAASASGEKWEC